MVHYIASLINNSSRCLLLILMLSIPLSAHAGWLDVLGGLLGESDTQDNSEPSQTPSLSTLSKADINKAFKQALEIGSKNVVQQLSAVDGFNKDTAIHIPLPKQLNTARDWLDKVGMSGMLDDLEVSLNRAAEAAMPETQTLFINTIKQMTFDDVKSLYQGPEDSATRFLQSKMKPQLVSAMTPVVNSSLSEVGAVKLYDDMMGTYQSIPFVPDIRADLTSHVVTAGLEGVFYYLAQQEAAIWKDPVR